MKRLHKKRFMNKSLSELHSEFMRECEFSRKLSTDTLRGYESAYKLFIKLMGEDIQLTMLTPEFMTEFFKKIDQRERKVGVNRKVRGVKKSTIGTYRSKLSKFFSWLEDKGHIKENPFKKMEYPDIRYEDRKFLKYEQIERIFNAVNFNIEWRNLFVKKRCLAILCLGIYCGLRKGEILGLRLVDLDFDRRQLTVRGESSKSKVSRTIPLHRTAMEFLRDYIDERKNSGCDIAKLKQLLGHRDIRMTAVYLRCLPTSSMRGDVERMSLENFV